MDGKNCRGKWKDKLGHVISAFSSLKAPNAEAVIPALLQGGLELRRYEDFVKGISGM